MSDPRIEAAATAIIRAWQKSDARPIAELIEEALAAAEAAGHERGKRAEWIALVSELAEWNPAIPAVSYFKQLRTRLEQGGEGIGSRQHRSSVRRGAGCGF